MEEKVQRERLSELHAQVKESFQKLEELRGFL